ncbi:MAG: hypothetical protein HY774_11690 [Acidobacteria bacterium]|nr:hypothetical protein [Acidobacteriota bacterium]
MATIVSEIEASDIAISQLEKWIERFQTKIEVTGRHASPDEKTIRVDLKLTVPQNTERSLEVGIIIDRETGKIVSSPSRSVLVASLVQLFPPRYAPKTGISGEKLYGILKSENPLPADEELKEEYSNYLMEKYR